MICAACFAANPRMTKACLLTVNQNVLQWPTWQLSYYAFALVQILAIKAPVYTGTIQYGDIFIEQISLLFLVSLHGNVSVFTLK